MRFLNPGCVKCQWKKIKLPRVLQLKYTIQNLKVGKYFYVVPPNLPAPWRPNSVEGGKHGAWHPLWDSRNWGPRMACSLPRSALGKSLADIQSQFCMKGFSCKMLLLAFFNFRKEWWVQKWPKETNYPHPHVQKLPLMDACMCCTNLHFPLVVQECVSTRLPGKQQWYLSSEHTQLDFLGRKFWRKEELGGV